MLKEQVENELKKVFQNYSDLYLIDSVINKKNIIVKDKYGLLKSTFGHLKEGKIPSISSAIDKKLYFQNKLLDIFPEYINHYSIEDILYIKDNKGKKKLKAIIKDKYGKCIVLINHLENKKIPTIQSALNKNEYFNNQLLEKNKFYKNNYFIIKSDFINTSTHIIIETKYGKCSVKPSNLLNDYKPTILSALNKTEFFIEKLKIKNKNIYDSLIFENFKYNNNNIASEVCCKKHGLKYITPAVLLRGGGCIECGYDSLTTHRQTTDQHFTHSSWVKQAEESENFKGFKVYILRCWDENEEFYKIGKTFKDINKRFYKCNMPYEYEILKIYENSEGYFISKLESKLKKENIEFKYIPKLNFPGMYECFKIINYGL